MEAIIARVGGEGSYQYRVAAIFFMKWMMSAMALYSMNFFFYVPDFVCQSSEASTSNCKEFVCAVDDEAFWLAHLPTPLKPSLVLDLGTVMLCNRQWIMVVIQSLSYAGSICGYLLMCHMADRFGRIRSEKFAWILFLAGCTTLMASRYPWMAGIGNFLAGFGANAAVTIHYSIVKEEFSQRMRSSLFMILQAGFSVGVLAIAMLCLVIWDWRSVMGFCMILPSSMLLFVTAYVEQTPITLLLRSKQELLISLNRIAKINQKPCLQIGDLETLSIPKQEQVNFVDLLKTASIRKVTIVGCIVNCIIQYIYNGTIFSLGDVGLNVYWNQAMIGAVEIMGAFIGSLIAVNVPRKKFQTVCFLFSACLTFCLALLSLGYTRQDNNLNLHTITQMVIIGFMRFNLNILWGIYFLHLAEMVPSQITSILLGCVSAIGALGGLVSPLIKLGTVLLTFSSMSVAGIIALFLVRLHKETFKKPIIDAILDNDDYQEVKDGSGDLQAKCDLTECLK